MLEWSERDVSDGHSEENIFSLLEQEDQVLAATPTPFVSSTSGTYRRFVYLGQ